MITTIILLEIQVQCYVAKPGSDVITGVKSHICKEGRGLAFDEEMTQTDVSSSGNLNILAPCGGTQPQYLFPQYQYASINLVF